MIFLLEIFAVVAAYAILVMAGITLFRNIKGFLRAARTMQGHAQTEIMVLMSGSDAAQSRIVSITGNVDRLQRKAAILTGSVARMLVIINAFKDARERISRAVNKLGF